MTVKFGNIRLVIFDLDGTLIDAFADIALAANHLRALNQLPELDVAAVKKHVGHGARHLVAGVLELRDELEIDRNHKLLVDHYQGLTDSSATIYDSVLATLATLRMRHIKTAIASNKPDAISHKVVEALGFRHLINYVRGEGPEMPRKPAPEILHYLMKLAETGPETTIMVGDSDVDIACARAAGVRAVAVTYGQYDHAYLSKHNPHLLIGQMDELLTHL